jgi:phosphatidylserine decarboxylase
VDGVDGGKKKRFIGRKGSEAYRFDSEANDIVGIVMLEIQGAVDLPRFKNSELSPSSTALVVVY